MIAPSSLPPDFDRWLAELCEDRLSAADSLQLEDCLRTSPAARQTYLRHIELHGQLSWDFGVSATAGESPFEFQADAFEQTREELARGVFQAVEHSLNTTRPIAAAPRQASSHWRTAALGLAGLAACAVVAVIATRPGDDPQVAGTVPPVVENHVPSPPPAVAPTAPQGEAVRPQVPAPSDQTPPVERTVPSLAASTPPETAPVPVPAVQTPPRPGSQGELVAFINEQLRMGWDLAGVAPSPQADDAEWLRRVSLDIVGHIPPVETLEAFLKDRSPHKRAVMIDRLLDDPGYPRHFAAVWTKLLVGQTPPRDVNRAALSAFLRRTLADNRPWSETVQKLLTAEGRSDENGAVNFLIAHLNDGAIPATAVTSRVLLGRQWQCTQCHNHPTNEWKQEQFWGLNAFFQQAQVSQLRDYNAATGKMEVTAVALTRKPGARPVFYETRSGLMKATPARYGDVKVAGDDDLDLRLELARLVADGPRPPIAEAFVNRTWSQFFGHGFTRQIDDLGPHNAPSHPELFDRLTREFVASGSDVKQLIRWICLSDAYQLTSRFGDQNLADTPDDGESPALFSHMYVKPMSPEQLYDSLLIASGGQIDVGDETSAAARREAWLAQFVVSFDTEENDEASTFNGTIPQSLALMNGDLVDAAVSLAPGSFLHDLLQQKGNEARKIERLFLSALSRPPSPKEVATFRKLLKPAAGPGPRDRERLLASHTQTFQDAYWAFLNSNEFILNH